MTLIRFHTHLLGEMSQVTSVLEHTVSSKKGVMGCVCGGVSGCQEASHLKLGIWTERTQYLHKPLK